MYNFIMGNEEEGLLGENTPLHKLALESGSGYNTLLNPRIYGQNLNDLMKRNKKGDTPLHIAARRCIILFHVLLENAEKWGNYTRMGLLRVRNLAGDTPLHEFARAYRYYEMILPIKGIKNLLSTDINFPQVNNRGESLLYLAVSSECWLLVDPLTETQVPNEGFEIVNDQGPNESTALHAAVDAGNSGMLERLLKDPPPLCKKAIEEKDWTLIQLAIERGNIDALKKLKEKYNDFHDVFKMPEQQNILHVAVLHQKMKVVKYIINDPAYTDLRNETDKDGNNALHLAATTCHPKIISLLLRKGIVDFHIENNDGMLPIQVFYEKVTPTPVLEWRESLTLFRRAYPQEDEFYLKNQKLVSNEVDQKAKEVMQRFVSTLTVVSTLVCTLTFAAAFTVPGGFSSEGSPVLLDRAAFTAFGICNTLAMCCSFTVSFLSVYAQDSEIEYFLIYQRVAKLLMWSAFLAMILAFGTGSYVILREKQRWLAIFILSITCFTPAFTFILSKMKGVLRRYLSRDKVGRYLQNLGSLFIPACLSGFIHAFKHGCIDGFIGSYFDKEDGNAKECANPKMKGVLQILGILFLKIVLFIPLFIPFFLYGFIHGFIEGFIDGYMGSRFGKEDGNAEESADPKMEDSAQPEQSLGV